MGRFQHLALRLDALVESLNLLFQLVNLRDNLEHTTVDSGQKLHHCRWIKGSSADAVDEGYRLPNVDRR